MLSFYRIKFVIIKDSRNSDEFELSEREGLRRRDGGEYFRVTIRASGLTASAQVYAFELDGGLVQFLEGVAASWRGWEGEKAWTSLEGELRFVCRSDSLGHITIEVTLNQASAGGWSVRDDFHVDAGQLEQIAANVKRFFTF
jgi:hypothetical protein